MWLYEVCPESIRPFWISRDPVAWPWCNLAASQRRLQLRIREQSLSRGASQSAVRCRWLSLCSVWPSHSQITSLSKSVLSLGKVRNRRETNVGCKGLTDLGDVMLSQESLHENCRLCRCIAVMKLICSLGHFECDGHTAHKLSQRCLTADWLDPRDSDCSRMCSKVCFDWLPSNIKATRTVLEIFKMDRYFPDSPRMCPIHEESYALNGRIEDEAFETLILFLCHLTNK